MKKIFILILTLCSMLYAPCIPCLAQTTINIPALPENTSPTGDDLLITEDDPLGTPVTKKATIGNLAKGMGWFDSSPYSTIESANTAAYNAGKTLVVSKNWTLTANTVLTASVHVLKGGGFTKASTHTLTINGHFEAGPYQTFYGFPAGDVTFAAGSVKEFYSEWWGNNTPGTTNMDDEIASAIASLPSGGGIVQLQDTIYLISKAVWANKNGLKFRGKGQDTTFLYVNTTFDKQTVIPYILTTWDGQSSYGAGDYDNTHNFPYVQISDLGIKIENLNDTAVTALFADIAEGSWIKNVSVALHDTTNIKRLFHIERGPAEISHLAGHRWDTDYLSNGSITSYAFYFKPKLGLNVHHINAACPKAAESIIYFDIPYGFMSLDNFYLEYSVASKAAIYVKLKDSLGAIKISNGFMDYHSSGTPIGIILDAYGAPSSNHNFDIQQINISGTGTYYDPLIRYIDSANVNHDFNATYFSQTGNNQNPYFIEKFTPHQQLFGSYSNLNAGHFQTLSEWVGTVTAAGTFQIKRSKIYPKMQLAGDNAIKTKAGAYLIIISAKAADHSAVGGLLFVEHAHATAEENPPNLVFNWLHGDTEFNVAYDATSTNLLVTNDTAGTLSEVTYSVMGVYSKPINVVSE